MEQLLALQIKLSECFGERIQSNTINHSELTIEVAKDDLTYVAMQLRDDEAFAFEQLIDVCGVDYLEYGVAHWETEHATGSGFDRAVDPTPSHRIINWDKPRYGVVYHLLSIANNIRIRLKTFVEDSEPFVDSVVDIWPSANWFERETFDLYGIMFIGHPDLRRILTDYGFIGHPFRKDFPVSGYVEPRYDAKSGRVVYEAVDIEPRILVPKVIREDSRYIQTQVKNAEKEKSNG